MGEPIPNFIFIGPRDAQPLSREGNKEGNIFCALQGCAFLLFRLSDVAKSIFKGGLVLVLNTTFSLFRTVSSHNRSRLFRPVHKAFLQLAAQWSSLWQQTHLWRLAKNIKVAGRENVKEEEARYTSLVFPQIKLFAWRGKIYPGGTGGRINTI